MSLSARARSEDGFTMIELVVAALITALIIGALAFDLIGNAHFSSDQRRRTQADEVAQQDQERLKGMSAIQLAQANGQQRTVTFDGTQYTVTTTTQLVNSSGTSSCGSTGASAAAYFKVISSANWSANLRTPVTEESEITPPSGGVLLTQVEDQNSSPVSGVAVSGSGADSASATTDTNGCTYMAGLLPGAYTLTLTRSGYIDPSGDTSPMTMSATVSDTGTSTPPGGNPVSFAPAGTLTVNFSTANGTLTSQLADGLSYVGAGSTQSMSTTKVIGPVTPASQLPTSGQLSLYPFSFTGPSYTNNYHVWPGICPQMQPPSSITSTASVSPGSTQTVTLPEPGIKLVVTNGSTQVKPDHVKISFQSLTGTSCSDSWYPTVAANAASATGNGALASPGIPFASTASSGTSASASGYTGSYSICADYSGRMTTVTGVTNTNYTSLTTLAIAVSSSGKPGTC